MFSQACNAAIEFGNENAAFHFNETLRGHSPLGTAYRTILLEGNRNRWDCYNFGCYISSVFFIAWMFIWDGWLATLVWRNERYLVWLVGYFIHVYSMLDACCLICIIACFYEYSQWTFTYLNNFYAYWSPLIREQTCYDDVLFVSFFAVSHPHVVNFDVVCQASLYVGFINLLAVTIQAISSNISLDWFTLIFLNSEEENNHIHHIA